MKEQLKKAEEKMQKTLTSLDKEYAAVRAGRANPAVLDKVTVDYYGVPTPINQMAAISVPEARLLVIQRRDLAKDIRKYGEESKVAVRSIRRDLMEKLKAMKKDGELTEDDLKDGEKEAQKLTDKYCKDIDGMTEKKEKEIMEL